MTRTFMPRLVTFAAMLAFFLAACGGDSPAGPPPEGGKSVASVVVIATQDTLAVGGQVTFIAEPRAADGEVLDSAVTWTSEHRQYATVTGSGVVKAVAPGAATIVATAGGRSGRAVLTVIPAPIPEPAPVAEVRLSVDEEVQLAWDGTTRLSAVALDSNGTVLQGRLITWQSSKPAVATVAPDGTVRATGTGLATVSAVSEGVPASVGVRVAQAPVVRVTLAVNATGLEVGETVVIAASVELASGQVVAGPVTWTSNAPAVAAVTASGAATGAVQALSEGNVTITAQADSASASVSLPVTLPPTHDLVYARHLGTAAELYTLQLVAGSVPVRINAGSVSGDPSPSPDGSRIAFAVAQPDQAGQPQNDLYIVNRNGMNLLWFTRFKGIEEQPAWSPDGSRILFRATDSTLANPNIWVMNVDGTGLVNLTAGLPVDVTDKRHPAWSPDGTRIAFIAARAGEHKVWIMNADGSNAAQLTTDAGFDQAPAWSPDGQRIAFSRYDAANPANGWDVMIVAATGGQPARLSLAGDQLVPAWSPDGRYIAVSGTAVAGQGAPQLYTMLPDGRGLRLRTVDPAWGGGNTPAWITRQ